MRSVLYWTVIGLMLGAFGVLHFRGDTDRVPPSQPLDRIPSTLAGMSSFDIPIPEDTLEILGHGNFLNRVYSVQPGATDDSIGLFIGYFPTQRTGQSIHSPQHCLPGAGWVFLDSGTTTLTGTDGVPHQVGDYLVSDGNRQAEVLYWYKTENRWIANDWAAKYYMLLDSMRYSRTDAALIRITTMVQRGEDRNQARSRVLRFAAALSPLLPAYIPD